MGAGFWNLEFNKMGAGKDPSVLRTSPRGGEPR